MFEASSKWHFEGLVDAFSQRPRDSLEHRLEDLHEPWNERCHLSGSSTCLVLVYNHAISR